LKTESDRLLPVRPKAIGFVLFCTRGENIMFQLASLRRVLASSGMKWLCALVVAAGLVTIPRTGSAAGPVNIVAAENFYGDVARQIGGSAVKVTSVLSNPDEDPHLFETSPSVARTTSAARVIIYNGIDYDPWMEKLVGAAKAADRKIIVVAELVGRKTGDNPHIWYDPATMLALAKVLADELSGIDPAHQADYQKRRELFEQSLQPIQARITTLRARLVGTPVTATEPVFGYMFAALGMNVRNMSFQMAVMNNTEPSVSDVAAFEDDLKAHRVRLLVYNNQASDPVAERMEKLAKASHVAVVGATETEPAGKNYQAWMMSELDAVDRALPK
jgi:zinc/manganese transport system substrate-binding protein